MELEIMLSKISQTQKDKYHTSSLSYSDYRPINTNKQKDMNLSGGLSGVGGGRRRTREGAELRVHCMNVW
jgi:hypothetical protein